MGAVRSVPLGLLLTSYSLFSHPILYRLPLLHGVSIVRYLILPANHLPFPLRLWVSIVRYLILPADHLPFPLRLPGGGFPTGGSFVLRILRLERWDGWPIWPPGTGELLGSGPCGTLFLLAEITALGKFSGMHLAHYCRRH